MTVTGNIRKTTGTLTLVARLVVQDRRQGRAAFDRRRQRASQACQRRGFGAFIKLGKGTHRGHAVADVTRRQPQLRPEGPTRATGDALDGGGNRLPGGDREREELRAVGYGGVDEPLTSIRSNREGTVHSRHANQGADKGACAQGNDRGAQGRGRSHCQGETGQDEPGDARRCLTKAEHRNVGIHAGEVEPACNRLRGGAEGIEGRSARATQPTGDVTLDFLTDSSLSDALRE